MKTFYQLTDCDDGAGGAGAWMPSEYFVDLILEGIQNYGDLSGKACTIAVDLAAGNGDVVNVRNVTPRTHACATTDCGGCLSVVSTTFGDYTITVYQQGDYDKIPKWADFQAKGDIMGAIADEMSKRLAHCRDSYLWAALNASTPLATLTTSASWTANPVVSGSCCSFAFDIYNQVVNARQTLKGNGFKPDYVLLHPYVASYFYYKEGAGGYGYPFTQMPLLTFGADGYVSSIAGLKVIEVGVAVDDDSTPSDGGDELAYVIDSKRALAEAWGMRPEFNEFYDGQCNAVELTVWTYWGCDTLDDNAIVEITNP